MYCVAWRDRVRSLAHLARPGFCNGITRHLRRPYGIPTGAPSAPPNDVGDAGLLALAPGPHPHYPRVLDASMYGTHMVAGELHGGNWTPAAMAVLNMVFGEWCDVHFGACSGLPGM